MKHSRHNTTLILSSELRSCVLLRLMLGQNNPIARLGGTVCTSGVMFKLGVVDTLLAFFVDLPMLGCLFEDSKQTSFRTHIIENCYKSEPMSYRGEVLKLIQGATTPAGLCNAGSEKVQLRIRDAMELFQHLLSCFCHISGYGGLHEIHVGQRSRKLS